MCLCWILFLFTEFTKAITPNGTDDVKSPNLWCGSLLDKLKHLTFFNEMFKRLTLLTLATHSGLFYDYASYESTADVNIDILLSF